MLDCPRCSKPTYDGTSCSDCGFVSGRKKPAAPVDPLYGRCSHVFKGQRCAERGTISPQTRGEPPWTWFCWRHYAEVVLGYEVPKDRPLQTAVQLQRTGPKVPREMTIAECKTEEQKAAVRALAAPHIAKCHEILSRKHPPDHPLSLVGRALAGISYDPEAVAERMAIQGEPL